MGLITPINLLALLGVPIIIILYMLRPKNTPLMIPSIYLWKQVEKELESASKIQKLRSSILMFLQIFAVILIALLLAGIYYMNQVTTEHSVIVIDNTATMQATDIMPNRFEVAKDQAIAYIEQLPDNQKVTLIELKDVPEIHLKENSDKRIAINMIEGLNSLAMTGDYNLLIDILSAYSDGEIVYFGDKTLTGATNYLVGGTLENVGIHALSSTISGGQVSVLADIYGEIGQEVQLSLYGDDELLDTILVSISDSGVGKGFFNTMPDVFSIMKVTVDEGDALMLDNAAYLVMELATVKKVALITDTNTFLEKVLSLYNELDIYKVQIDDRLDVSGFDLYIYDGIMPELIPEDGLVMVFNPDQLLDFESLGFVNNPDYMYFDHPLTSHLMEGDYVIGLSHVYETPLWAETVMACDEGTIAFSGTYQGRQVIVFGFDIHNTDMPLTASFPILMTNMIDYYLNQKQVVGAGHQIGDSIEIHFSLNTESAYILMPNGDQTTLDIDETSIQFSDTEQLGIYELFTRNSEGIKSEHFAVNGSVETGIVDSDIYSGNGSQTLTSKEELRMILGGLLLAILCIEWIIYGLRRRRV